MRSWLVNREGVNGWVLLLNHLETPVCSLPASREVGSLEALVCKNRFSWQASWEFRAAYLKWVSLPEPQGWCSLSLYCGILQRPAFCMSVSTGEGFLLCRALASCRNAASLQWVGSSASCCTTLPEDWVSGFLNNHLFHLLVKGDGNHLLADVCQNVALEQEEVMAPGMKPCSPWVYTQPEQLL